MRDQSDGNLRQAMRIYSPGRTSSKQYPAIVLAKQAWKRFTSAGKLIAC